MMTRAQVQANRIRGLTAHEGSSLRKLHAELCQRDINVGVYETFRRRMAPNAYGVDSGGSSYHVLKGIADVFDVPLEWVAGDDGIDLALFARGVYVNSDACRQYVAAPVVAVAY